MSSDSDANSFATWLQHGRAHYVAPIIFIYASVAPFPNELLLVPLALAGIKLRVLIIPLIVGTIFYQTAFAIGIQNLFTFLVL